MFMIFMVPQTRHPILWLERMHTKTCLTKRCIRWQNSTSAINTWLLYLPQLTQESRFRFTFLMNRCKSFNKLIFRSNHGFNLFQNRCSDYQCPGHKWWCRSKYCMDLHSPRHYIEENNYFSRKEQNCTSPITQRKGSIWLFIVV